MARDTMGKRALVLAVALATAAVGPIGCGPGGSGGTAAPTPPALPVATRAFVHVLGPIVMPQGRKAGQSTLTTFEVVAPTGVLHALATTSVEGGIGLAADPRGRFAYVGGCPANRFGSQTATSYVRSYAVDGSTGPLSERSEVLLLDPYGHDFSYRPTPLAATEGKVFVKPAHNGGDSFFVYASDEQGYLSEDPQPYNDFDQEADWLVPLPSSPIVFADYVFGAAPSDGIAVMSPRPDGSLQTIGVAPTPGLRGRADDAALTDGCLVAAWTNGGSGGGGISSYRVDGTTGMLTAGSTVSGFVPIHVAAGPGGHVAVTTASALLPYLVTATCELVPRATLPIVVTVSGDHPASGRLAFHPSGLFVYVDVDAGLQVDAVLDSGDLQVLETHSDVHGRIAVAPAP